MTMKTTASLYNPEIFDLPEAWVHKENADERARADRIETLIPADAHSILDVGCGRGQLVNRLLDRYDVTGVDRSTAALQHVKARKQQGTGDQIEFPDGAFDLVVCSEVLEHLTDELRERTVAELRRVSRKYLLVTVPDREQLERNMARCDGCSQVFHRWGHLRSFTQREVMDLFAHDKPLYMGTVGKRQRAYNTRLLRLRTRTLSRYCWELALYCPRCGRADFPKPRFNPLAFAIDVANGLLHPLRRQGLCIVALFKKHGVVE
jgi:SAM-dependent methyltransferase